MLSGVQYVPVDAVNVVRHKFVTAVILYRLVMLAEVSHEAAAAACTFRGSKS